MVCEGAPGAVRVRVHTCDRDRKHRGVKYRSLLEVTTRETCLTKESSLPVSPFSLTPHTRHTYTTRGDTPSHPSPLVLRAPLRTHAKPQKRMRSRNMYGEYYTRCPFASQRSCLGPIIGRIGRHRRRGRPRRSRCRRRRGRPRAPGRVRVMVRVRVRVRVKVRARVRVRVRVRG